MGGKITRIQPNNNSRILIGVDPGATTGVSILDEKTRQILGLYALDFWSFYDVMVQSKIDSGNVFTGDCQIYIEQPSQIKFFWHGKALANSPQSTQATRDKMVWNCAENSREGILLAEGLRKLGYTVFDVRPVGRKKWNSEEFQQITGWTERSNQHVRDATFLIWDKQWK